MIQTPIRVMLVDDLEMVRFGLISFLEMHDDIRVVAEAADGSEALDLCSSSKPDVIVMDLRMPEMDGVEATRAIKSQFPKIRVIILTNFNDGRKIQQALDAGAEGYMLKKASIQELITMIRSPRIRNGPKSKTTVR